MQPWGWQIGQIEAVGRGLAEKWWAPAEHHAGRAISPNATLVPAIHHRKYRRNQMFPTSR